jgi:hypothetical protein
MPTKPVAKAGVAIIIAELVLLAFWLISGVVVWLLAFLHDEEQEFLELHIIGAFHFPTTVTMCLILEHYTELVRERQSHKRTKGESGTQAAAPEGGGGGRQAYLLSWLISLLVVLGTDVFSVLVLVSKSDGTAQSVIELVYGCWALLGTILALSWSPWFYAKLRKEWRKRSDRRSHTARSLVDVITSDADADAE